MIAGIVLAAGRSLRMGEPKAFLRVGGETFLERAVAALRDGGCDPVVVVSGPRDDPMGRHVAKVAERLGAVAAVNPRMPSEQVDSLRAGLLALPANAEAAVVLPVDIPLVSAHAVRLIVEAFRARGAPVVRATAEGRHGHPVLFARAVFAELLAGDLPEGARTVIGRHADAVEEVPVAEAGALADVDTPEDYRRLLASLDATADAGGATSPAPLSTLEAVRLARRAVEGGDAAVGVLVVDAPGDGAVRPGARMVVRAEGREGTLGSAALDDAAAALARPLLAGGPPRAAEAEGCSLYLEPHLPPPELVIVGAGHIARPLCRVGAMLGFRVTVLDDRPEFATRERFPEAAVVHRADFSDPFRGVRMGPGTHLVLVTRGHKYDFEALRDVLRRPAAPAYVGMVGSRRRTRAALELLSREGIPDDRLRAVHAPIGLDVGAETPEEIAVSIMAEIVLVRRGGTGVPLRGKERVAERWVRGGGE